MPVLSLLRQASPLASGAHQVALLEREGSVPSFDGTLAKRWHGRAATGRVRAKTGTLDKVVALAGYVAINGDHPIAFAILVNDIPPGQRASARTAADEILAMSENDNPYERTLIEITVARTLRSIMEGAVPV